MKLRPLTRELTELARQWRNDSLETLRTPYPLTKEMQEDFYDKVICDRNSPHRYYAIVEEDPEYPRLFHYGVGGITSIQWENRIGEISLILDPKSRGMGNGKKAVKLLLEEAFNRLNLKTVYGECYMCNSAWEFWKQTVISYGHSHLITLPNRKFWNGKYWDSLYFSIDASSLLKTGN